MKATLRNLRSCLRRYQQPADQRIVFEIVQGLPKSRLPAAHLAIRSANVWYFSDPRSKRRAETTLHMRTEILQWIEETLGYKPGS